MALPLPATISKDSLRALYEALTAIYGALTGTSGAGSVAYASDANRTPNDVTTSGTIGTWVELMPANANRNGASVQAVYTSGNTFINQYDAGFPASGRQPGDIQIPAAPAYFKFDFNPKKRYVVRGDTASLVIALNTW